MTCFICSGTAWGEEAYGTGGSSWWNHYIAEEAGIQNIHTDSSHNRSVEVMKF